MGGEEPDRHDEIAQQAPAASAPVVETQQTAVASAPVVQTPAPAPQPVTIPDAVAVHEPEAVSVAQTDVPHEAELVHEPEPAEHTS